MEGRCAECVSGGNTAADIASRTGAPRASHGCSTGQPGRTTKPRAWRWRICHGLEYRWSARFTGPTGRCVTRTASAWKRSSYGGWGAQGPCPGGEAHPPPCPRPVAPPLLRPPKPAHNPAQVRAGRRCPRGLVPLRLCPPVPQQADSSLQIVDLGRLCVPRGGLPRVPGHRQVPLGLGGQTGDGAGSHAPPRAPVGGRAPSPPTRVALTPTAPACLDSRTGCSLLAIPCHSLVVKGVATIPTTAAAAIRRRHPRRHALPVHGGRR